jgi:hypothetical protein
MTETVVARQGGWDWRPLARLACWGALGAAWAAWSGLSPWGLAVSCLREVVLLCLLSLGLLVGPLSIIAMGAVRLYALADETLYAFADGFVGELAPGVSFGARFLGAVFLEVVIVTAGVWSWRALGGSGRLLTGLGALLGC